MDKSLVTKILLVIADSLLFSELDDAIVGSQRVKKNVRHYPNKTTMHLFIHQQNQTICFMMS